MVSFPCAMMDSAVCLSFSTTPTLTTQHLFMPNLYTCNTRFVATDLPVFLHSSWMVKMTVFHRWQQFDDLFSTSSTKLFFFLHVCIFLLRFFSRWLLMFYLLLPHQVIKQKAFFFRKPFPKLFTCDHIILCIHVFPLQIILCSIYQP